MSKSGYRLYKRKGSETWQVDFGDGIRRSTKTGDKAQADAWAKHHARELWEQTELSKTPSVTWDYAVVEWLKLNHHKKSIEDDKQKLRRLSKNFRNEPISAIGKSAIDSAIAGIPGISNSTRNRYRSAVSVVLNFAHEQGWRPDRFNAHKYPEARGRIRYLTPDDAGRLLNELPDYLRAMAAFSLSTGLRESNVRLLEWSSVDLGRSIAWVYADQAKAGKDITVPLNASAMDILEAQRDQHWKWVFPYNGRPLYQCNTTAWESALKRAGIDNFRWHDLRHTWASWHVQNGTSIYELKELGGWASLQMVERYAHLSREKITGASRNIENMLPVYAQKTHSAGLVDDLKGTQDTDFTGRSWRARTADQRIKSQVIIRDERKQMASNIIDLRDEQVVKKQLNNRKITQKLPGMAKILRTKDAQ